VRQTFLLDENILYHAIRRVDKHNIPDSTAAELIDAIGEICHVIFVHPTLIDRYQTALKKLRQHPPRSEEAKDFLKQLLYNNLKRTLEYSELPDLPPGVQVPRKDEHIVRAALISRPTIVAEDSDLLEAINNQPELGLQAMDARMALEFAKSEQP